MNRWPVALALSLALAAPASAQPTPSERAEQELRQARREHLGRGDPERNAAYDALNDARDEQRRYYDRERELEPLIIVEEALIHRDRRYVAEGKPAALARRLAAEEAQAAADRRQRRFGKWAQRRYPVRVRQAELWAIDAVQAQMLRDERFRREVCRQILELAEQMEDEARAKKRPPALKRRR